MEDVLTFRSTNDKQSTQVITIRHGIDRPLLYNEVPKTRNSSYHHNRQILAKNGRFRCNIMRRGKVCFKMGSGGGWRDRICRNMVGRRHEIGVIPIP